MTVETYQHRAHALYVHTYDSPDPAINRLRSLDQAFMSSCFQWYDGYLWEGGGELEYRRKPKPYGKPWVPNKREQRRLDNNVRVLEEMIIERAENHKQATGMKPTDELAWKPRACYFDALLEIPDDVRPDWLAATDEFVAILEAFYSDPKQYCHDFYYPSDNRVWDEERKLERKVGKKPDTFDLDTDEGMTAFLDNVLSDSKHPAVIYVPDEVVKAKLMKIFDKELKKRHKFLGKVRARIDELKQK